MTRQSLYRISLASLLLLCLLSLLRPETSFAKEISLSVSPSVINFQPLEDGVLTRNITVENKGADTVELDILLKPFKGVRDNEVFYPVDKDVPEAMRSFITNDVQVLENDLPVRMIELAPGQKKQLKLQIAIKNIHDISEYTFSILLISRQTDSPTDDEDGPVRAGIGIQIGTGTHVLIRGQAQDSGSLTIEKFQTEKVVEKGPVVFQLQAQNNASKYIEIYGSIVIENMFGQKIGLIRIPQQIILKGQSKELEALDSSGQLTGTQWQEGILFGSYKAILELNTLDNSMNTFDTITFFVFPTRLILILLIAILSISFIISEVRKKLR